MINYQTIYCSNITLGRRGFRRSILSSLIQLDLSVEGRELEQEWRPNCMLYGLLPSCPFSRAQTSWPHAYGYSLPWPWAPIALLAFGPGWLDRRRLCLVSGRFGSRLFSQTSGSFSTPRMF